MKNSYKSIRRLSTAHWKNGPRIQSVTVKKIKQPLNIGKDVQPHSSEMFKLSLKRSNIFQIGNDHKVRYHKDFAMM